MSIRNAVIPCVAMSPWLLVFALACKESKFSGGGKKDAAHQAPAPTPTPPPSPNQQQLPNCSQNPVVNETEVYKFNSFEDIREFVNKLCKTNVPTQWADAGAMRNDDKTAEMICKLQGFQRVEAKEQFEWHSPGDNGVAWWEESTNKFFVKAGSKGNNFLIKTLTCRGKVFDQCKPDTSTIDCQP